MTSCFGGNQGGLKQEDTLVSNKNVFLAFPGNFLEIAPIALRMSRGLPSRSTPSTLSLIKDELRISFMYKLNKIKEFKTIAKTEFKIKDCVIKLKL